MKIHLFYLWALLLFASDLTAQIVTVKDQLTQEPLELVTLYSPSTGASAVTDREGRADLSEFVFSDTILLRLIGYREVAYSYEQLEALGFVVVLAEDQISLEAVVVSASRWRQAKREVPQKITSVSPREVALQNPQTAADLLSLSGEVFIQKSQLGGGSPMIRGFATNRVLIAVDGVRMNTAIFRSGNLQNVISLDPYATERTEVLFGPGSVMYGSDAIGGAMNFFTLTPALSTAGSLSAKANAAVRLASANEEKTGHLDFSLGWKKWALATSASYSDYGDLKMGSNGPDDYLRPFYAATIEGLDTALVNPDPEVQVPTGYHQYNLLQKVRFQPN
ncbi:MAG: TonB-dependent receptor plug domain-containing protein, partial [Saprospiraceae bacterium]|nr:TonB-dependent receptor plug domain-containing protein [Saprospiraceae bacterium]MCB0626242.1 TonB-dependent receptor plug domain-containing protein [Saprospiraceae bacterium]